METHKVKCRVCDIRFAQQRHHIVPKRFGGDESPTVPLCRGCHREVDIYSSNLPSAVLMQNAFNEAKVLLSQYEQESLIREYITLFWESYDRSNFIGFLSLLDKAPGPAFRMFVLREITEVEEEGCVV